MEKIAGSLTSVGSDVELDLELLSSFSMVNVLLASDPEVVDTIERRVNHVENNRSADLRAALGMKNLPTYIIEANKAAVAAIRKEMGLIKG